MKKPVKERRYCLEKLIDMHKDTKMETWKFTDWCDDDADLLSLFLGEDYRIFDTHERVEIRRNVNIDKWLKTDE